MLSYPVSLEGHHSAISVHSIRLYSLILCPGTGLLRQQAKTKHSDQGRIMRFSIFWGKCFLANTAVLYSSVRLGEGDDFIPRNNSLTSAAHGYAICVPLN